jgi:hypothetical protein
MLAMAFEFSRRRGVPAPGILAVPQIDQRFEVCRQNGKPTAFKGKQPAKPDSSPPS